MYFENFNFLMVIETIFRQHKQLVFAIGKFYKNLKNNKN